MSLGQRSGHLLEVDERDCDSHQSRRETEFVSAGLSETSIVRARAFFTIQAPYNVHSMAASPASSEVSVC